MKTCRLPAHGRFAFFPPVRFGRPSDPKHGNRSRVSRALDMLPLALLAVPLLLLMPHLARAQAQFWPSPESGAKLENVTLNGAPSPQTVAAGSSVTVALDYTIVDILCPSCIDQIQYGFVNLVTGVGEPVLGNCIYDGIPGPQGVSGSATVTLQAPSEPGEYAFTFDWINSGIAWDRRSVCSPNVRMSMRRSQ